MKETFYEPVFKITLEFHAKISCAEYTAYLKKTIGSEYCGLPFAGLYTEPVEVEGQETIHRICISTFDGSPSDISILCHEVNHFVFHALNFAGIAHNKEADEVYAYYVEYWMKTLLMWLETN